ncbi:MAG: hypothetical protein OXC93_02180 [Rhodospirillaceae bacterium]|nr:hypothetical protein [Rhodospirillaceae bacterium]
MTTPVKGGKAFSKHIAYYSTRQHQGLHGPGPDHDKSKRVAVVRHGDSASDHA